MADKLLKLVYHAVRICCPTGAAHFVLLAKPAPDALGLSKWLDHRGISGLALVKIPSGMAE